MDILVEVLDAISGFVWGPFLLIPILLLTGLYRPSAWADYNSRNLFQL